MPNTLTVPTIHLGGTSKTDLVEDINNALNGVQMAMNRLQAAAPNARDYYPQGPDAFGRAIVEHSSRVQRLNSVLQELSQLAIAIYDGGHKA